MYKYEETVISDCGLRYTSKEPGSPYQGMAGSGETLSCIRCGRHKLRRNGVFRRYLHSPLFYCFDCKPQQTKQLATPATVIA
jgi:hypothetical protein